MIITWVLQTRKSIVWNDLLLFHSHHFFIHIRCSCTYWKWVTFANPCQWEVNQPYYYPCDFYIEATHIHSHTHTTLVNKDINFWTIFRIWIFYETTFTIVKQIKCWWRSLIEPFHFFCLHVYGCMCLCMSLCIFTCMWVHIFMAFHACMCVHVKVRDWCWMSSSVLFHLIPRAPQFIQSS